MLKTNTITFFKKTKSCLKVFQMSAKVREKKCDPNCTRNGSNLTLRKRAIVGCQSNESFSRAKIATMLRIELKFRKKYS